MNLQEIKNLGRKRYKIFGSFYRKNLIYKITNLLNGKIYIGQTTNLSKRIKSYLYHGTQKQGQQPIHRTLQKYGLSQFSFEIVEELSLEYLDEREKYWINYYKCHHKKYGYNLTLGGVKFRWSEENKEKRKKSAKNKKEVFLYKKDGSFYKKFESMNDCAAFFKIKHCSVWAAIKNNNLINENYRIRFEFDYSIEPYENLKGQKIAKKLKNNRNCLTYIWKLEDTKNNKIYEENGIRKLSIVSGYSVYILTSIAYNRPGNAEFKKILKITKLNDNNTNNS